MVFSPIIDGEYFVPGIEDIIGSIRNNRIRITDHAYEESISDGLDFNGIFFSVFSGEVIEIYDDDRPYPSVLICGKDFSERYIHTVWAYNKLNKYSVLITVYRPDPERWSEDLRRRKK